MSETTVTRTLDALLAQLVVERGEEAARAVLERCLGDKPTAEEVELATEESDDMEHSIDPVEWAWVGRSEEGFWLSGSFWHRWPDCDECNEPHHASETCEHAKVRIHGEDADALLEEGRHA